MSEIVQGLLITVLSGGMFAWSEQLPPSRTAVPGAGFFPELVAAAGVVFGVIILVRGIRSRAAAARAGGAPEARPQPQPEAEPQDWGLYLRIGGPVMLASALFVFAFERLGFLISSFLFLAIVLLLLGERRPLVIVIFSAGLSAAVYYLFNSVLQLPLPAGLLG